MLEILQKQNPRLALYSVESEEFSSFGRVLKDMDVRPILEAAKKIQLPEQDSCYVASEPQFEALPLAKEIRDKYFGTLPTQVGYCWGYNRLMNATEWHFSSEINIAVTPLILILCHIWDIRDGKIEASQFKAFYLPAGTAVEVYATSGHYCPCQIAGTGFGCVVALPEGTNTPLEQPAADPLLFRRNKWIIAHEENQALIDRGVVPGITGENYCINY